MIRMRPSPGWLAGVVALWLTLPPTAAAQVTVQAVNAEMASAAEAFLESLRGAQRAAAQMILEDSARVQWAYIPTERAGLALSEMNADQRLLVYGLLESALSGYGYLKVTTIMHLDEILRQFDDSGFERSGENYLVAVFGDPTSGSPWGWRFEGHHVSLNFTSTRPADLSVTPLFLGANPAEVRGGIWTGLRALGEEEDLGWRLLQSLSAEQQATAIVDEDAPSDILTRNDPIARDLPEEGLRASAMTAAQRAILLSLVSTFAGVAESAVAEARLAAMRDAGFDNLRFAWAGGTEPGSPYYYRVAGPSMLIELDNVQGGGNHVHSVWRDRSDDFGGDALRQHYESAAHAH